MNLKFYIISIFLLINSIWADEKSALEIQQEIDSRNNQIELLKKEISEVEAKIIKKTKDQIAESEILLELQNKIILTEKLINSIEREERLIKRKIDKSKIKIIETKKLIKEVQDKLKKNIIYAYKKGMPTFLDLIFNKNTLKDLTYKTKYLNIINEFQKSNKEELKELISQLENENLHLNKKLNNKKQLKGNKAQEQKNLQKDINKKNKLLDNINSEKKQKELLLITKQDDLRDIEDIINRLYSDKITQEKREQELAKIRQLQKMAVNGNFSAMKGSLPWPIRGTISSKFGNKRNVELNTITENLGVNIKSNKEKSVIAVLDGIVSSITYIRGVGNIIILDHGDGFNTVYSNIENILIEENEYVSAGSTIAQVDQNMVLHFQIWHNKQKKNPEKWLIK